MAERTILLDGDPFCYQLAYAHADEFDFGDGAFDHHGLDAALEELDEDIKELMDTLQGDKLIVALTCPNNWRYAVLPSYKSNRGKDKPVLYSGIRQGILDRYEALLWPTMEADDLLGIHATCRVLCPGETVIVSPDKDMKTIPGLYSKGGEPMLITPFDADLFHLTQTLTGDQVDGYKGCPWIGPKKALKIFQEALGFHPGSPKRPDELSSDQFIAIWQAIVQAYEDKNLTEQDALVQARVARICRSSDYDPITREVILWNP